MFTFNFVFGCQVADPRSTDANTLANANASADTFTNANAFTYACGCTFIDDWICRTHLYIAAPCLEPRSNMEYSRCQFGCGDEGASASDSIRSCLRCSERSLSAFTRIFAHPLG